MVVTGLKTAVETLQERMDSLAAELKRVLAGITTGINKQGELIKEIKNEMKDINMRAMTILVDHQHHPINK